MEKWLLRTDSDGFYTGNSYIYQGYKYAVVDKDLSQAKEYSSYNRALSANNKLNFENYYFKVARKSDYEK